MVALLYMQRCVLSAEMCSSRFTTYQLITNWHKMVKCTQCLDVYQAAILAQSLPQSTIIHTVSG